MNGHRQRPSTVGRRWAWHGSWIVWAALLLSTQAAGYDESAAASLSPSIVAAWHEPEAVRPGTQWEGFLQVPGNATVTAVRYQVCNVEDGVCFAPPQPATRLQQSPAPVPGTVWRFNTTDYLASDGAPVDWEAGWRVGVKWILSHEDGREETVPSPDNATTLEDHYLAFDIPSSDVGAPGPAPLILLAVLLAAATVALYIKEQRSSY